MLLCQLSWICDRCGEVEVQTLAFEDRFAIDQPRIPEGWSEEYESYEYGFEGEVEDVLCPRCTAIKGRQDSELAPDSIVRTLDR